MKDNSVFRFVGDVIRGPFDYAEGKRRTQTGRHPRNEAEELGFATRGAFVGLWAGALLDLFIVHKLFDLPSGLTDVAAFVVPVVLGICGSFALTPEAKVVRRLRNIQGRR